MMLNALSILFLGIEGGVVAEAEDWLVFRRFRVLERIVSTSDVLIRSEGLSDTGAEDWRVPSSQSIEYSLLTTELA